MPKGRILAVCFIWLCILGLGIGIWKWFVQPAITPELTQESRYENNLKVAIDSFSGYAILRSPEFRSDVSKQRIKVELMDHGPDYLERAKMLENGDIELAVFTVDALLKTADELKKKPGVIIAIIDETRGADAAVAYKKAIPNVDALNHPDTKFVLTPDSPSETLSRVVMSHFALKNVGQNPFVECDGANEVYKKYRSAKPDVRQVFVLWEPYVTRMLDNPNTHVVIDTSSFHGYIVDVMVANEEWLLKNQDVAAEFIKCYLRSLHANRSRMVQLVMNDAKELGEPLTMKQAERLVQGLRWKNTTENYAHLGLEQLPLQHLEDMIENIANVLVKTGDISNNHPFAGKSQELYYDGILKRLSDEDFHPGVKKETTADTGELGALTDSEWNALTPVGTMEIPTLIFPRGTNILTEQSQKSLDQLIEKLKTLRYYVLVRGNASREGDLEANKALAQERAKAAEKYLIQNGISAVRVRAIGVEPSGSTSVSFVLGSPSY